MKVSVPKEFGNTSKKPILPLVPEPIKSVKKTDLTTVNLNSDPTDHGSTQVKFSFKGLDGDNETPREIVGWRRNVEQALRGHELTAGTTQHNMAKQFMRGSGLSSFESTTMVLLTGRKGNAIVHVEMAVANYPPVGDAAHDAGVLVTLQAVVTTATRCDIMEHLGKAYGVTVVTEALNEVLKCLLPNKTLQRVKRYFRHEARMPLDRSVKQHIMHIH